jgi:hypothetical protein
VVQLRQVEHRAAVVAADGEVVGQGVIVLDVE